MTTLRQTFSRAARGAMALVNGRAFVPEQTEHQDEELARLHKRIATAEAELSEVRAELAKREALDGDASAFFVVGQSKSGTGWLMKILDSHPEILCRGGGRFFGRHLRDENLKGMQASEAVRAKIQPSSLHNALLNAEYLRLWIERSSWSRDEDPDEHLSSLTRLSVDYFLGRKLAKSGKRFVLVGSVRDDGPLPDVHTDVIVGQRAMRAELPGVGFAIMVATMLHSIATGNILPASVPLVCVDINPATVTKLADRGSAQAVGIVTDIGLFLEQLARELVEGYAS